jgi:hypothetical protein
MSYKRFIVRFITFGVCLSTLFLFASLMMAEQPRRSPSLADRSEPSTGLSSVRLAPPTDRRLNAQAHFGGDAFYCVDTNQIATNTYESMGNNGGMQLLDRRGAELWFITAADIAAVIASGGGIIAQGQGTYGAVTLSVAVQNNVPTFTGFDEHGKSNAFSFTYCNPLFSPADVVVQLRESVSVFVLPPVVPE